MEQGHAADGKEGENESEKEQGRKRKREDEIDGGDECFSRRRYSS